MQGIVAWLIRRPDVQSVEHKLADRGTRPGIQLPTASCEMREVQRRPSLSNACVGLPSLSKPPSQLKIQEDPRNDSGGGDFQRHRAGRKSKHVQMCSRCTTMCAATQQATVFSYGLIFISIERGTSRANEVGHQHYARVQARELHQQAFERVLSVNARIRGCCLQALGGLQALRAASTAYKLRMVHISYFMMESCAACIVSDKMALCEADGMKKICRAWLHCFAVYGGPATLSKALTSALILACQQFPALHFQSLMVLSKASTMVFYMKALSSVTSSPLQLMDIQSALTEWGMRISDPRSRELRPVERRSWADVAFKQL